jgi:hypothetical protein
MKKKIVVTLVLVLMLVGTFGAFAAETKSRTYPWMASYNDPGHLNVYGAVGLYYGGLSFTAGAEIIISKFDIAGIPLEFGVMGQGILGFDNYYASGIDWGVAPLASLHWGWDFGKPWRFDWYVALGLGIYGGPYQSAIFGNSVGFGFASYEGFIWELSDNLGLMLEYGYIGWTSVYGVGVTLKL